MLVLAVLQTGPRDQEIFDACNLANAAAACFCRCRAAATNKDAVNRSAIAAADAFAVSHAKAEADRVLQATLPETANPTPEQLAAFQEVLDANEYVREAQRVSEEDPGDKDTIAELLRHAAEAGYAMGQFEYGKMILHGQVRGKNVQDAIHWLSLAAEQKPDGLVFKEMKNFGVVDAAQKLGGLYLAGFNNQPPD
jgi:TPR repeat protein